MNYTSFRKGYNSIHRKHSIIKQLATNQVASTCSNDQFYNPLKGYKRTQITPNQISPKNINEEKEALHNVKTPKQKKATPRLCPRIQIHNSKRKNIRKRFPPHLLSFSQHTHSHTQNLQNPNLPSKVNTRAQGRLQSINKKPKRFPKAKT